MGIKNTFLFDRMQQILGSDKDKDLAATLGISPQAVSNARKKGEVPADMVLTFAEKNKLSVDWLLTGKGRMYMDEAEYPLSESEKNGDKIGEVPGGDLKEGKDIKKADRSPVKAAAVSYIDAMTDYEASGVINYILLRQTPQRNQRT